MRISLAQFSLQYIWGLLFGTTSAGLSIAVFLIMIRISILSIGVITNIFELTLLLLAASAALIVLASAVSFSTAIIRATLYSNWKITRTNFLLAKLQNAIHVNLVPDYNDQSKDNYESMTRAVTFLTYLRDTEILYDGTLATLDFSRAVLRNADLRNASLRYANLTEADLRDADLTGADLSRAVFKGANLTGATLTYTKLPPRIDYYWKDAIP